jgi:hypothetical protein
VQRRLLERLGAERPHDTARLHQVLAGGAPRLVQVPPGSYRTVPQRPFGSLQVHSDAGEALDEGVMDLTRQPPALLQLAGLARLLDQPDVLQGQRCLRACGLVSTHPPPREAPALARRDHEQPVRAGDVERDQEGTADTAPLPLFTLPRGKLPPPDLSRRLPPQIGQRRHLGSVEAPIVWPDLPRPRRPGAQELQLQATAIPGSRRHGPQAHLLRVSQVPTDGGANLLGVRRRADVAACPVEGLVFGQEGSAHDASQISPRHPEQGVEDQLPQRRRAEGQPYHLK